MRGAFIESEQAPSQRSLDEDVSRVLARMMALAAEVEALSASSVNRFSAGDRELSSMRLALTEENPAHLESIRVIERDQRQNEELLGRLHDQKIFYRPKKAVYVGG